MPKPSRVSLTTGTDDWGTIVAVVAVVRSKGAIVSTDNTRVRTAVFFIGSI